VKLLKGALLAAILLFQASIAEAAVRHRLDLPGGRLGDAIVALGRQAGISIGVSDPALAAQRVPPLRGRYTVETALRRLLRGLPARHVTIDGQSFRIVRRAVPPGRRRARPPPAPSRPAPMPPEPVHQDIIVTATKRSIHFGAYPGSVSVVDGADPLLQHGLRGSDALVARLPTLTSTHLGPGRNKLFLRGIADSSFNGPTQATVGQYLGETRLNYNAPDPDLRLYDIDRIEILPGPQGTLYGAGSLGGIIRLVPNRPDLDETIVEAFAGGSLTAHGDPGGDAGAVLNVPIVADRIGLRLVGYGASEGGYIDETGRNADDVNRTRVLGGRASLRAEAADGWTIMLGGAFQHIDGEAQYAERDAPPLTRNSGIAQDFSNRYGLGEFVVSREWDDLRFVTATGLVRQVLDERYDSTRAGGPPTAFDQQSRITLLSAESRLSRQREDGSGWLVGTSFIRNVIEQNRALGPPEAPLPITGVRNAVTEATAYGEGAVSLGDRIVATAGVRLTHSRLSGAALDVPAAFVPLLARVQANRSETAFLPSFSISARLAPGLLAFARYQEGFRPGGLAVSGMLIQRFRSDSVDTLEAGLRYGRPGAGRFDAAMSIAYTRWTDVQADIVDMAGFPTTANIGDGRIYSLDVRAGWRPLPGLSLDAAATVNDSRVTDAAPSIIIAPSSPLPNVARWNARLAAEYEAALSDSLDLQVSAAARYVGDSVLGIGAVYGAPQGDWLDISLLARVERGRQAFTFGVTNLLDTLGNRFAMGSPFTLVERPQVTPLRPRTVRIGWETRF
jgi:outer membrane receptor protein involved in Fe transport